MKVAGILINELDKGMDRLHFWIHCVFRKVKIFSLKNLIPACGSIVNPIKRRCQRPRRDISQTIAFGDSSDRRAVQIAAEENHAGNFLLSMYSRISVRSRG